MKVVFFPNTHFNKPQINNEISLRSFWLPALQPQLLQWDPKREWGRTEVVAGIQPRPRYAFWQFWYTALPKGQPNPTLARHQIFNWLLLGLLNRNQMNLQVHFQTKPISNNGFSFTAVIILEWAFNVFRTENVSQTHCKVGSVSPAFAVCAGIRFPD